MFLLKGKINMDGQINFAHISVLYASFGKKKLATFAGRGGAGGSASLS